MPLRTQPCKHGELTFFDNDYWIGGALRQTGEYSEGEVQKLLSLVAINAVIVEVGANIGAITVPLAHAVATVHAFEPQRAVYDVLCSNIVKVSGTVYAENKAVGSRPGFCSMEPIDLAKPGINTGAVAIAAADKTGDIEVTTLDLYCRNFARLDLIKIDVEGHESEVIAGAVHTINRLRPVLYVENDRADKSKALIEQIFALGYVCYWHLPLLWNPDPAGEQNVVSVNMVCLPADLSFDKGVLADLWPINSAEDDWRFAYDRQFKLGPFALPARPQPKIIQWATIVRQGGIGDNLIASAVLPYLKEKFGRVEVITQEPAHVVFENNPHIDKLSVKKPKEPPWGDGLQWQNYWVDRASECAFFAQLGHSLEGLRAYHASMSAFYWSASARRKFAGQSYLETVADICGVPYDRLAPNFFPTESEAGDAERTKRLIGERYVGWVLTGSRADKIWPFASIVIARVVKELSLPVVMFGAPGKDFEIAKEIEKQFVATTGGRHGLHLALSTSLDRPNWPIRRSLAQLQAADIVVTPDTGPAWAVAMRPMPKIVLISHASAENITKRWINTVTLTADQRRVPCWPCHLLHDTPESCQRVSGRIDQVGAACITDIGADVVFDQIAKAAKGGRASWTSSSP